MIIINKYSKSESVSNKTMFDVLKFLERSSMLQRPRYNERYSL